MIDISRNPRLAQIIGRIEEIRKASGLPATAPPDRTDLEPAVALAVADLYADAGRYIHWMLRQDPAALARIEDDGRRWAAEVDARLVRQAPAPPKEERPTEKPPERKPARQAAAPEPKVRVEPKPVEPAPDRSDRTERSDRTRNTPMSERSGRSATPSVRSATGGPRVDPEQVARRVVAELLADDADAVQPLIEDLTASVVLTNATSGTASFNWLHALRELLAVIGEPEQGDIDDMSAQVAANRLLNATTQMEVRWMGFPDAVQQALVGMISNRARNLQDRMPVDIELRMALGRLRRFHAARGMPAVLALRDDGRPEHGSWEADARRWWLVLDKVAGG